MQLWRERSLQFTEKAPTPARQLPITGSAHKAGNGRRPLLAAIGIARSVRGRRENNGWRNGRPNCCRFPISTSSSRLPAPIAAMAFQNKGAIYAILFKSAVEAMTTLAANPRRLGAKIGGLAILHTWGQALTHHPHVHCVVARRRAFARRLSMDRGARELLSGRQAAFPAVPPPLPRTLASRL